MADDFDGTVINEESVDGFFNRDDGRDTADLERKVKEAAYTAEIEEIEKLTEALSRLRLAKTELTPEARKKGLAILEARRELVDSLYDGPLPKIKPSPKPGWSPARLAAQKAGSNKYQEEGPCVNGHNSPRYVGTTVCVACTAERGVIRRAKHSEKIREDQ